MLLFFHLFQLATFHGKKKNHLFFQLDHDRLTGGRHGGTNLSETGGNILAQKYLQGNTGKLLIFSTSLENVSFECNID